MSQYRTRLTGDIDLGARPRLKAQLRDAAEAAIAEDADLTIDASDVTFMDSTGIGLVVQATLHMRAAGLDVRVAGAPAIVRRVFEISGLGDLLVE